MFLLLYLPLVTYCHMFLLLYRELYQDTIELYLELVGMEELIRRDVYCNEKPSKCAERPETIQLYREIIKVQSFSFFHIVTDYNEANYVFKVEEEGLIFKANSTLLLG